MGGGDREGPEPEPPEWAWLPPLFKTGADLAERVFRVQWSKIAGEAEVKHRADPSKPLSHHQKQTAFKYVRQARKNPDSVRWAENANARAAESRAAETGRSLKRAEQAIASDLDALAGRMTR